MCCSSFKVDANRIYDHLNFNAAKEPRPILFCSRRQALFLLFCDRFVAALDSSSKKVVNHD